MKVLVTGANGFVGSSLCNRLINEKIDIRAISRNPAPYYKKGDAIEWIQVANIDGETDWSDTRLKEVDVVVHLASRVHVIIENEANPKTAFIKTNVDGTKKLAEAAIAAGVKRFIYISTAHVHGHVSGDTPFKENSPANPHSDYATSKWKAEEALSDLYRNVKSKQELVIIRPPLVYGAGVKANFERLLWIVEKQIPLPLKKIENKRSLIYVDNLADFIIACIKQKKLGNETFLVADSVDISTPLLLDKLALAMDKRSLQFSVKPAWIFKLAQKLKKETIVNSLCANLQVDSTHAQNTLKWKAPVAQDEALKVTAQWYKQHSIQQQAEAA